jgi:bacterioferritin
MSKKLIDALNKDREGELSVIIQYMKHHYEGEGMESPAVLEIFKSTAKDEMGHAEKLGERIVYLGGIPYYKAHARRDTFGWGRSCRYMGDYTKY